MFYFSLLDINTDMETDLLDACREVAARLLPGTDKGVFVLECADSRTCFRVSENLAKSKDSRLRILATRIATEADGRFLNARR